MIIEKHIPLAESAQKVGIDLSVLQSMIDEMTARGIDLHSIMVIRDGKVAGSAWKAPLSADMPHMAYSVSKSFLATAYGFALDEGYLTKETRFLDVFPEHTPEKKDEYLERLTILQLISMTSGKRSPINGHKKQDWMKSFLGATWQFAPGESWCYTNENYYIAAAALVKLTGQSITSFLTKRLYEPLGMEVPFWETSPDGIEAGGWGLQVKTEDIAKLLLCYLQDGMFEGEQVVPAWWAKEATAYQNDNSVSQKEPDSRAGYGYGFWQCAGMKDTFRAEGVYCQYGIAFREQNAVLVMTSSHAGLQDELDVVWKYMPRVFIAPGSTGACEAPLTIPDSSEPPVLSQRYPEVEKSISQGTYKMLRRLFLNFIGMPVSMLPSPVLFFSKEAAGNMTGLTFDFDRTGCVFSWTESGGNKNQIRLGMNGEAADDVVRVGEMCMKVRAYAYWLDAHTLCMNIRPYAAVAARTFRFKFRGGFVLMLPNVIPSIEEKAKTMGETIKCILPGAYFAWWVNRLVPQVPHILMPPHYGIKKKR